MERKLRLNGLPISSVAPGELDCELIRLLSDASPNKTCQIVTFNSLMYLESLSNPGFYQALKNAELILPESSGIRWALNFLYNHKAVKLAGIELVEKILKIALEKNLQVFLLGAHKDVIETAVRKIKAKYTGIKIAGFRDGYFSDSESDSLVEEIAHSGADILLAGLGVPKQEIWLARNKNKFGVRIAVGVGGSFDVLSGKLRRAPKIFIELGVEWLYRLALEPWRIKCILKLPVFVFEVLKIKFEQMFDKKKHGF